MFIRGAIHAAFISGADAPSRHVKVEIQTDVPMFEASWLTVTGVLCVVVMSMFALLSLEPAFQAAKGEGSVEVAGSQIANDIVQSCSANVSDQAWPDDAVTQGHDMWKYACAVLMTCVVYVCISFWMMGRRLTTTFEMLNDLNADEPDAEPPEPIGVQVGVEIATTTMNANVYEPEVRVQQQVIARTETPAEVCVTATGRCYQRPRCHVLRNRATGNVRNLHSCDHCIADCG